MAKKATKKATGSAAKRSSARRERVNTGTDARFVKRAADGTFKESDDVGRSQRTDRTKAAKTTVGPGYGDQGDQARKAVKRAAKKR